MKPAFHTVQSCRRACWSCLKGSPFRWVFFARAIPCIDPKAECDVCGRKAR